MENNKSNFFLQLSAGIFGGTILGLTGGDILRTFIKHSSDTGSAGEALGIILGSIIGVAIACKLKPINYKGIVLSLLITGFILTTIVAVISIYRGGDKQFAVFMPLFVLAHMIEAAIASLIIIAIMTWFRKIFDLL